MLCERAAAVNTQFVSFEPNDIGAGCPTHSAPSLVGRGYPHISHTSRFTASTPEPIEGVFCRRESSTCYAGACSGRCYANPMRAVIFECGSGAQGSSWSRDTERAPSQREPGASATSRATSAKVLGYYRGAQRAASDGLRESPIRKSRRYGSQARKPRVCVPAAAQASLAHSGSALLRIFGHVRCGMPKSMVCHSPRMVPMAGTSPMGQAVSTGETTALARVLQATARCSIRGWAFYFKPFYHYALVITQSLKVVEAKPRGAERIEKGSGVF